MEHAPQELLELLELLANAQAHIENDLYKNVPRWRDERDRLAKELAEYYNTQIYTG